MKSIFKIIASFCKLGCPVSLIYTITLTEVLELQRGWLVNQNGGKIVPKNHPNKKITVNGRYNNFTLLFDGAVLTLSAVLDRFPSAQNPDQLVEDKLVIKWDGYVSVQIQTPAKTRTCGMCGNNDGNPANDMRMRRRGLYNFFDLHNPTTLDNF